MLKAALKPILANLLTLNMNNNSIDYDVDFFSEFDWLWSLSLQKNKITEIKGNQFKGLNNLYIV
jgi:hypothetical protein